MLEKKKNKNILKDDPVSELCNKRGIGRAIAEEIVKREQAEAKAATRKETPKEQ